MKDFHFIAPTEIEFGAGSETRLAGLVRKYGGESVRVMIHYGGGSAVRSGLIDRTKKTLADAGIPFVEMGGVRPNPRLSTVRKGIELCRTGKVNLILAVGGGSVIDSAKAIAYGTLYNGDVWDFFIGKAAAKECLPVGCILTIPAAGSEMSDCSVISNEATQQKLGYSNDIARPKFAIMNPMLTTTLPAYQTACGAVDIMMHTMERYFTRDTDMDMNTAMGEALMRTVKLAADALLCNGQPEEPLRHRATLMWASSWAHNDFTGTRVIADFATHKMEHELSALFDVAHGAGLAALWPSWARYVLNENPSRFASFAVNVLGCEPAATERETALCGVEAMEATYRSWNMPTCIGELLGRTLSDSEMELMADKCTKGNTFHPGYFKALSKDDVAKIYKLANH
ncbi:MAG: iron-containing alcohol dehydrogenase [Bacteroidales bacterium]|nr:iron-containing alcohol dehydrogenase [Bacteroidales bacterium]